MLQFNLEPVFKARGIDRPYTYLVKAGMSAHSANSILNNTARTMRLDHLELLCRVLICEPNDLLVWTGDATNPLPDNHPLHRLEQSEPGGDLKETIARMPYKELKAVTKSLTGGNQNPG